MPRRRMKRLAQMGLIGGGLAVGSLAGSAAAAAAPAPLDTGSSVSPPTAYEPASTGVAEADGSLWTIGGSFPSIDGLGSAVVGWAARPGGGAWEVAAGGGVFSRGSAPFLGSLGGLHLGSPITAVVPTPSGQGYWLVSAAGGVFAFGDATFKGAAVTYRPSSAIVGAAATPDGAGYWLVTASGGVYGFGDAGFHGSMAGRLTQPLVGIAPSPTGGGYWLASRGGGIYALGDATFAGSAAGQSPLPILSITPDSTGYDLVRIDGETEQFRPGATPGSAQVAIPANEVATAEAADGFTPTAREAAILDTAVSVARSEVGKPYAYGAAGPNDFDCSGLTQYAFAAAGVSLPHNAAQQYDVTVHVAASQLQPGDLVFFYPGIQHVGIYIGDGEMIDAPTTGSVVRVDQIQYFGPLEGASDPAL